MEYRFCESGEDLEAIYRLRYKSYLAHGLVADSSEHLIYDKLDETSNCYRFGIFIDGELASTIRLHHLSAAEPYSPAMSVFGDILEPRLRRGDSFVDPSRLAADPELTSTYRGLPYITMRLAVAACNYFDATSCLSMVREEHQAFYRRVINAVQVGEPRAYASVKVYGTLCEVQLRSEHGKDHPALPLLQIHRVRATAAFPAPETRRNSSADHPPNGQVLTSGGLS